MKTTPAHSKSAQHSFTRGFTLIEILVVVVLVGLIFTFATPYTLSAIQAASLTSAGDTLMQKLSHAQQMAVTENRPIGVDFYFYDKDGVKGCHAVQMITYDMTTNQSKPLGNPNYWSEGRVILVEGALTPLFAGTFNATDAGTVTTPPFADKEATFKRILFYPNGTTSLRVPLRNAYMTLVSSNNYREELEEAPRNYYTVQIDPVTGRTRSYRP